LLERRHSCRIAQAYEPGAVGERTDGMLKWAFIFLVVSLIAALFGFTSIAGAAMGIAKFLFFIFIAIFVVLIILAVMAKNKLMK
jgi:uncharacterized membrane protein YtjA (UPF0391 family)